ncbi:MAG: sigma-70 family RNA polymerase sigma factor [bacterium]|nr:sigma-70 family RNA polymerase sigma factor [bacterium]
MTNEELVQRIKDGDSAALEELYSQVKSFIHSIAWKYRGYAELEDLEQEGFLGLYDAVEHYNPAAGYTFLTYAGHWIKQHIRKYINDCAFSVRIPAYTMQKVRDAEKAAAMLEQKTTSDSRKAPLSRLDREIIEQIEQSRKTALKRHTVSLDAPIKGFEEDITLADTIAADGSLESSVLDALAADELREILWKLVDALPKEQASVLHLCYEDNLTRAAAGDHLGISHECVRRHERQALRELREPKNSRHLLPYWSDTYSAAIRGCGVQRFKQTFTSSTERAAIHNLEEP